MNLSKGPAGAHIDQETTWRRRVEMLCWIRPLFTREVSPLIQNRLGAVIWKCFAGSVPSSPRKCLHSSTKDLAASRGVVLLDPSPPSHGNVFIDAEKTLRRHMEMFCWMRPLLATEMSSLIQKRPAGVMWYCSGWILAGLIFGTCRNPLRGNPRIRARVTARESPALQGRTKSPRRSDFPPRSS